MHSPFSVTLWHLRSGVRCFVKFIPAAIREDGSGNVRVEYSFRHPDGLPLDLEKLAVQVQTWTKSLMRHEFGLPQGWRYDNPKHEKRLHKNLFLL